VSKKIAEGAGTVVYDVKCGSGAFMKTPATAHRLASRLVAATRAMGRRSSALVTDMSQPLGEACGNALEVEESVAVLRGGGPADVRDLTLELAALMLAGAGETSGVAGPEVDAAREQARRALDGGAAYERFLALVGAQGGDPRAVDRAGGLARAPIVRPVRAARGGVIATVDTFRLGELLVTLGAGRRAKEDRIDPAVGMRVRVRIGDPVDAGAALAELHLATDVPGAEAAAAACFALADGAVAPPGLVLERIGG
jgi:pyrimidine-nucleoside phosphorylase